MTALDVLIDQRAQAERDWNWRVERIRSNPNQMNVRGVWQIGQLQGLALLCGIIQTLDAAILSIKHAEAERSSKKTASKRKRSKGRHAR